jgi:hypothetical protein
LDDSAQVAFINAGASNVTGTVLNSGGLDVDATSYNGGSSLTIEGTLTNSGTLDIGNDYLEHATSVTVAALTDYISTTLGTINIAGDIYTSDSSPISATLDVASAAGFGAAGDLIGSVNLTGNGYGHAVLEFASGEITTIGASSELTLNGSDAFVADASNIAANSALTSLASVTGSMSLMNSATVSTSNALSNTGGFTSTRAPMTAGRL